MDKEELERELFEKSAELASIKEVLALYLDKSYENVDNIVPEDLEYKLRENLTEKYRDYADNIPADLVTLNSIFDLRELCRELGWTELEGYPVLHNIKLFIKSLARENYKLKKMVSDKQNGDTRTNNMRSSDTTSK